jgi:preprotein translocase subunit SecB
MEVSNQPKLQFHGADFSNVHFDGFKQYDGESKIDLSVEPKVFYDSENQKLFKIIMDVKLICEEHFELIVLGIGTFEFDQEISDLEMKKSFVNQNAPAIMFPYVRAFIGTLTSNLGSVTGCLTIPTQFFQGELEEVEE